MGCPRISGSRHRLPSGEMMMSARLREAARRLPVLAVVDDDRTFREDVLLPVLSHSGFCVVGMDGALELYRSMTLRSYDLILLDVGLPDEDGFSIAAHLRRLSPRVGIVMLTGYDSAQDRMRGLRAGADAYLPKPVDMDEVVTTLHNLARWVIPDASAAPASSHWRLDERGWCILTPGGVEIELNLAERQVMAMLAAAAGLPVQRETLIASLVKNAYDFDPHRLEMLVHRLRKKCQQAAEEELPLRAVRGIGYVLNW
ncbi:MULTISPECIES: response regulator transcription factor [unclassified Lysobacter]|uniref:response regulator transcription factor n=1 Tax=unclassified Lysobacter TaxID=2635362 RepID=UPI001BE5FF0F|nr:MULTISPECIES: response regulator transcription factor [unclassified Lysobacter]MBT2747659.1 response regulator transcription factor [Lysobacter sp. ISL-42]MBT2752860.1 response regulator transcription factor [Lysobacter sp. ISL-50]MBT2779744.1 response regulator transcription factor [Lysobacter sp. ISL-54]MBT2784564.1 response regulator transcription factor [Lysobacter sp. ISL-52]